MGRQNPALFLMLQARMGCKADEKTTKWQGNDAGNKPFHEQKIYEKTIKKGGKSRGYLPIFRWGSSDFYGENPLEKAKNSCEN